VRSHEQRPFCVERARSLRAEEDVVPARGELVSSKAARLELVAAPVSPRTSFIAKRQPEDDMTGYLPQDHNVAPLRRHGAKADKHRSARRDTTHRPASVAAAKADARTLFEACIAIRRATDEDRIGPCLHPRRLRWRSRRVCRIAWGRPTTEQSRQQHDLPVGMALGQLAIGVANLVERVRPRDRDLDLAIGRQIRDLG